mgnify:FL=1
MKNIILTALMISTSFVINAQSPPLINYQGVARNAVGNAIPNRTMSLRLSIHDGSSTGTVVYSETRQVTTNGGGLYTAVIGSSGAINYSGTISGINWQNAPKFLQVEIDPDAGTNFLNLGTTQLVSVPYALSASIASPVGIAGGDLTGAYPNPSIANGAITTLKLADAVVTTLKLSDQSVSTAKLLDASVTDSKIVGISGIKVLGNISGNSSNVTGIVALANGGTGAISAPAARNNLGLGNVDNTSDLSKPISTLVQLALDQKENSNNKSTNISLGNSDVFFPTQRAVKTYVDAQVNQSLTPDATSTIKGKLKLSGDLAGTADLPVLGNSVVTTLKIANASVTDAKIVAISGSKVNGNITGSASNVTGIVSLANGGTSATNAINAKFNLGLGNVNNTSDVNKPISTATQTALNGKENISNKSSNALLGTSDILFPTQKAVKTYVDVQVAASLTLDATSTVKGKLKLAGDLSGTADLPSIATGAVTTLKLANASVTDSKIVSVSSAKVVGNISGNAANVSGIVALANGGTGATSAAAARLNLGATTIGNNLFTLSNPNAISFPRINLNNTVSALSAVDFRNAIGASSSLISPSLLTTSTYTLTDSDNGKNISINNANGATLVIPSGLQVGFNCSIIQRGAGQITIQGAGTTLLSRNNFSKTAGQYAVVSVISTENNTFILSGDISN